MRPGPAGFRMVIEVLLFVLILNYGMAGRGYYFYKELPIIAGRLGCALRTIFVRNLQQRTCRDVEELNVTSLLIRGIIRTSP